MRHEFIVEGLLNKYSRTRRTYLSLVKENAELNAFQCQLHIRILEEYIGRLAAQFQSRRDNHLRRRNADFPADLR